MTKYGFRDNKISAKKVIIKSKIPMQYAIPLSVAAGTSGILTGHDFNATAEVPVTNTGILAQPPYPMQLHLNWNVAGASDDLDALNVVGQDAMGVTRKEALAISSAASGDVYTNYAYANIDSLTPNKTITTTSVGIGYRAVIGVPYPIDASADIISYTYDGAYATTAHKQLTVSGTYNTVTLPAMAASKDIQLVYMTFLQE